MTPADYHALDRVSSSRIQQLAKSWAHYDRAMASQDSDPPSAAMAVGSAVHAYLLQPDRDLVRVVECGTRAAKAYVEASAKAGPDEVVILASEAVSVACAVSAARSHPLASTMLGRCPDGAPRGLVSTETAITWDDGGVACKALLDALWVDDEGRACILDVKTTREASPDAFGKSCANYGYVYQAAWYLRALAHHLGDDRPNAVVEYAREGRYRWLAVETSAPYVAEVYTPAAADIARADATIDGWLDRIRHRQPDEWRGYTTGEGPHELAMPRWSNL